MTATALLRNSGALPYILKFITPVLSFIKIPPGIAELILLRPISGSGSIVLLTDIYKNFTPDSYEGILASIIAASTETTIYTAMVYFGVTSVKKTKLPLTAGLITDAFGIIFSMIIANLFFKF
jgi:spore maturation protein B